MRRVLVILAVIGLFLVAAPVALGADPIATGGGSIIRVDGNVVVPAGSAFEAVVAIQGDALVHGTVDSVVVIGGQLTLTDGARVADVTVIDGVAAVSAGATVTRQVTLVQAVLQRDLGAMMPEPVQIVDVPALAGALAAFGAVIWLGLVVAMLLAGLLLAGIAGRQMRAAGAVMRREPLIAIGSGLLAVICLPILGVLAMVTLVGIPAGIAVLFLVLPVLWFIGYVAAGIAVGDLTMARLRGSTEEHPYLAAVVGLVTLEVVSLLPLVGFLVGLFGAGGIAVVAARALRSSPTAASPSVGTAQQAPTPA